LLSLLEKNRVSREFSRQLAEAISLQLEQGDNN